MINFSNFVNENTERYEMRPDVEASSFVQLYNKREHKTYIYVDDVKFKNKYGNLYGYLYISGMSGMRVNFKGKLLHSISMWDKYDGKTPETTVIFNKPITTRKGILDMYPEISNALCYKRKASTVYVYDGKIYASLEAFVQNVYFYEGWCVDQILESFGENAPDRKKIISIIKSIAKLLNKEIRDDLDPRPSAQPVDDVITEPGTNVDPDTLIGSLPPVGKNTTVEANVTETVEESESAKMSDEELANQLIADPIPVFRMLNTYCLMVARGLNNGLLITGQGGVGKSYNVNKILSAYGKKGVDYVVMKGNSTISAMYKFLYDNYDKIVVFDDCDSVLDDSVGLNILKGVLDSGDVREVSWNSSGSNMVDTFGCDHDECEKRLAKFRETHKGKEGIPNYFRFMGACIFISNLSFEQIDRKEHALVTRCTCVDINLLASEVILRMESVLPHIKIYDTRGRDITKEDIKQKVFEYISSPEFLEDPRIAGKQISFRIFNKAYMFCYAGLPSWKELSFCT